MFIGYPCLDLQFAVVYPLVRGYTEHRELRVSLLDDFPRAFGVNFLNLSHLYLDEGREKRLYTAISCAQVPGIKNLNTVTKNVYGKLLGRKLRLREEWQPIITHHQQDFFIATIVMSALIISNQQS